MSKHIAMEIETAQDLQYLIADVLLWARGMREAAMMMGHDIGPPTLIELSRANASLQAAIDSKKDQPNG